MKYFHRTPMAPDDAIGAAARFFGARMQPTDESARRRAFSGAIGQLAVTVEAEGGHYTLITVETNQPGESEVDKTAKRFLATVHAAVEPAHVLRGAY